MAVHAVTTVEGGEAVAFCWQCCANAATRSYPLYPSETALADAYRHSAAQAGGFQAASVNAGLRNGVVFGFALEEDLYLQSTGFYVSESGVAAGALADWLAENFKGYTANIGLPMENAAVADALRRRGYELLDDTLDLRLRRAVFREAAQNGLPVQLVTVETLPRYLAFHQTHFDDCYWNAQRLRECFADWRVVALEADGEITGGLFMHEYAGDAAEIYGLHAETEPAAAALLSRAIGDLLKDNAAISSVLFMADTADAPAIAAALSLGFQQKGHYHCYAKTL